MMNQPLCSLFFPSTVSSSINALVAVTMEDFILPVFKNLTEKQVYWMNMGLSKYHSSGQMSRDHKSTMKYKLRAADNSFEEFF